MVAVRGSATPMRTTSQLHLEPRPPHHTDSLLISRRARSSAVMNGCAAPPLDVARSPLIPGLLDMRAPKPMLVRALADWVTRRMEDRRRVAGVPAKGDSSWDEVPAG
jgi:hypothetical protein